MGKLTYINTTQYPLQNPKERVKVIFPDGEAMGIIVREDLEEPFRTIILLDDGRYVLDTECIYQKLGENKE